jgi:hypothetical protein
MRRFLATSPAAQLVLVLAKTRAAGPRPYPAGSSRGFEAGTPVEQPVDCSVAGSRPFLPVIPRVPAADGRPGAREADAPLAVCVGSQGLDSVSAAPLRLQASVERPHTARCGLPADSQAPENAGGLARGEPSRPGTVRGAEPSWEHRRQASVERSQAAGCALPVDSRTPENAGGPAPADWAFLRLHFQASRLLRCERNPFIQDLIKVPSPWIIYPARHANCSACRNPGSWRTRQMRLSR